MSIILPALILIIFADLSCSPKLDSKTVEGSYTGPKIESYEKYGDDFFPYQWHLYNFGQLGGTVQEDANVFEAWKEHGTKGYGIEVVIVDDGIEIDHTDLIGGKSYNSYDFLTGSTTLPIPEGYHGTSVAGIIGAREFTGGVKGVAPQTIIRGYNLLASNALFTTANVSTSMTRDISNIDISNNSWGKQDGTGHFQLTDSDWTTDINTGLSSGRGGRGTIYVWAAGNGHPFEMASHDGYLSHPGVIPVCSVNDQGTQTYYSEGGPNLWVCAPSGDSGRPAITTTDISGSTFGYNGDYFDDDLKDPDYTKHFSGTSASTPIVSGVVALILEENPTLSYRDVKIILAKTARQNDDESTMWQRNRNGYNYHPDYGFGVVDAKAAVTAAKSWVNVGAEVTDTENETGINIPITHSTQISRNITVSGSSVTFIEYIQVTLDITHGDWGDLNISLKRDGGNFTYLSENHYCFQDDLQTVTPCDTVSSTYTFGVSKFIGESPDTTWTLDIQDVQPGFEGTLNGWEIKFYGH